MSPAQAVQPQATCKVRVGDAGINVAQWGDGPTVVLLHGNPDSARKVVHLPEIGHWPAVEAPDACAEAILKFFS
jgi:pimeloyl-ACP methyl ester carboxylesterase